MKIIGLILCLALTSFNLFAEEEPLNIQLGEKLFNEYRFSQKFTEDSGGDVNNLKTPGAPHLLQTETILGTFSHPQKGQYTSCSTCHFVDQPTKTMGDAFVLTYNDLLVTTPIPERKDQLKKTTRNSMNMVVSAIHKNKPLHWDGEFFSAKALAGASLTGRNMGWLNSEAKEARQQIVKVLREDKGNFPINSDINEAYTDTFKKLGFDFNKMNDDQVFQSVCQLLGEFMESLDFSKDSQDQFNGSAYDKFLEANGIRRAAKVNESSGEYLQHIRDHLNYKTDWQFIKESPLQYHSQNSKFGKLELQGMMTFFGRAQCASCHKPPEFTDYGFHTTGISQFAYDRVHGSGAFSKLKIPNWDERKKLSEKYFVSSEKNPNWQGVFRKNPRKANPDFADLGVWNMLGHPDKDSIQSPLRQTICDSLRMPECKWTDDEYLEKTIGMFKTPTLRSLGQSAPYFHDGSAKTLHDVLAIYIAKFRHSHHGKLVNGDPMFRAMHFSPKDIQALEAFLNSLNEDYD